jgi:hypothetical protein
MELAVLGGLGRNFYVSSAGLTDADAPGILCYDIECRRSRLFDC